ncbi:kinetochore-associated Ndc80 complex subunit spc25 [Friedmanniomyces endolithicus]|nr:kinetochore-associated Ndc80 complex subunit spc25 [Friedmanniomyces endolithicus]
MATLITPSRFSSSLSVSQAQYGANVPSMADTLPSIDFGFNDLRERMAQFTVRFDDFIARGQKRVLDERNAFRMSVAELEESQRHKEHSILALEAQSTAHAHTLAKEAAETAEMHAAIHTLTTQKDAHLTRRDALKTEIADVQTLIKVKREAQTAHQRSLDAQARHNIPELRFWEHCLGLRIEGTGVEDCLRFVFLEVDGREAGRECWFELLMGGREYEVGATKPKLVREEVDEMQERLNEGREQGGFLKGMRGLFVQGFEGWRS